MLEAIFSLIERVTERLRPNVIIIALLVYFLIKDFGDKLIAQLNNAAELPPEVIVAILSGLIGTGIGGLISAMMRMFESPSIPADIHERMVQEIKRKEGP